MTADVGGVRHDAAIGRLTSGSHVGRRARGRLTRVQLARQAYRGAIRDNPERAAVGARDRVIQRDAREGVIPGVGDDDGVRNGLAGTRVHGVVGGLVNGDTGETVGRDHRVVIGDRSARGGRSTPCRGAVGDDASYDGLVPGRRVRGEARGEIPGMQRGREGWGAIHGEAEGAAVGTGDRVVQRHVVEGVVTGVGDGDRVVDLLAGDVEGAARLNLHHGE